jgi:hypothetical protein
MARNVIGNAPFEVSTIDTDSPINEQQVRNALGSKHGVSLCVRSASGPEKRGGYFFHIQVAGADFNLLDFEGHKIDCLVAPRLIRFINHASGRLFDSEMLTYSQSVINFREDQIAGAIEA